MNSLFNRLRRAQRVVSSKAVLLAALPLSLASLAATPGKAQDGDQPYIGEIRAFAGSFCPRGWSEANGQLVDLANNSALFSLYGTIYGGDGQTTFALPDLRGRTNIEAGTGPGLTDVRIGTAGGAEQVTLTQSNLPGHNHILSARNDSGILTTPAGNLPAQPNANGSLGNLYAATGPTAAMGPGTISATGQSLPHNNMAPYLVIKWCVAMEGLYPPRS